MSASIRIPLMACLLGCVSMSNVWAIEAAEHDARALNERIQDLKSEVIQLNRDLMVLEEELLFPATTQIAVFVSMDAGRTFSLESVQLKIDNIEVANYLYTPVEMQALHRGGVQRLFIGNLRAGEHSLVAFFSGRTAANSEYRQGATMAFQKKTGAKYLELQIEDDKGTSQPVFRVKQWQ